MALTQTSDGRPSGKKQVYIRPAVPLKWEKKTSLNPVSSRQHEPANSHQLSPTKSDPDSAKPATNTSSMTTTPNIEEPTATMDTLSGTSVDAGSSRSVEHAEKASNPANVLIPTTTPEKAKSGTKSKKKSKKKRNSINMAQMDGPGQQESSGSSKASSSSEHNEKSPSQAAPVDEHSDKTLLQEIPELSTSPKRTSPTLEPSPIITRSSDKGFGSDIPSESTTAYSSSGDPASAIDTQQTTPATPFMPDTLQDPSAANMTPNPLPSNHNFSNFMPHPAQVPYYGFTLQQHLDDYPLNQPYYGHSPYYFDINQPHGGQHVYTPFAGQTLPMNAASSRMSRNFHDPNGVTKHIVENFNIKDFSDVIVRVKNDKGRPAGEDLHLHRIVLARSGFFEKMLARKMWTIDEEGKLIFDLKLSGPFFTYSSLTWALRTCYGESPNMFTGLAPPNFDDYSREKAKAEMTESLGFVMAGQLFELNDVVSRGFEIATMHIGWATIEYAIAFIIQSFDSDESDQVDRTRPVFMPSLPPHGGYHQVQDFLSLCLQFISDQFPHYFKFDKSAQLVSAASEQASYPHQKFLLNKSRLTEIQFGDHNTEGDEDISGLLSRILLSLHKDTLSFLIDYDRNLNGRLHRHTRQVIAERNRRQRSEKTADGESVPSN